jgi:hypothetical protein
MDQITKDRIAKLEYEIHCRQVELRCLRCGLLQWLQQNPGIVTIADINREGFNYEMRNLHYLMRDLVKFGFVERIPANKRARPNHFRFINGDINARQELRSEQAESNDSDTEA